MRKVDKYVCPECKMVYKTFSGWSEHMHKMHPTTIPKDFTDLQYFYFTITGRTSGSCVQCHKPTTWNEASGKYNRYCANPECKKAYCKVAKQRMVDKYGKVHLLNDPEKQRDMLAHRKISGKYTFKDGSGSLGYVGSYERDFLMTMDTVLGFKATDIMSPSPHNYVYMYNDKPHFYIPDFYIPNLNLEIEIKDGGQRPNNHPKIIAEDKVKEALKDEIMRKNTSVNYFKVVDEKYTDFFKYLLDLKTGIDDDMKNSLITAMASECANDFECQMLMASEHCYTDDVADYEIEMMASEDYASIGRALAKNKTLMNVGRWTANHGPAKLGMEYGKRVGQRKVRREYAKTDISVSDKDIDNASKAMEYLKSSEIQDLFNVEIAKIAPKYDHENTKTFISYMKHSYVIIKSLDVDKMKSSGKAPAILIRASIATQKAMKELMGAMLPLLNAQISSKFNYTISQAKTDRNLYNLTHVDVSTAIESVENDIANESAFIDRKDEYFNIDQWKRSTGHNILYIAGLSGSGKSTLGRNISKKYNAMYIELDRIVSEWWYEDEKFNPNGYQGNITAILREIFKDEDPNEEIKSPLDQMVMRKRRYSKLYEYCLKHPDQLFVFEGIQVAGYFDNDFLVDKPVIIKNTSRNTAFKRMTLRDRETWDDRKDYLHMKADYKADDHNLDSLRKIMRDKATPSLALESTLALESDYIMTKNDNLGVEYHSAAMEGLTADKMKSFVARTGIKLLALPDAVARMRSRGKKIDAGEAIEIIKRDNRNNVAELIKMIPRLINDIKNTSYALIKKYNLPEKIISFNKIDISELYSQKDRIEFRYVSKVKMVPQISFYVFDYSYSMIDQNDTTSEMYKRAKACKIELVRECNKIFRNYEKRYNRLSHTIDASDKKDVTVNTYITWKLTGEFEDSKYTSATESVNKSEVDDNYKANGHKTLSSFRCTKLTHNLRKKYESVSKMLKHANENDATHDARIWFDDNDDMVAHVCVFTAKKDDPRYDGYNWISSLEVSPEYRGYGLGKQLLNFAVDTMGGTALAVYNDNEIAIKMYEDKGFRFLDKQELKTMYPNYHNSNASLMVLGSPANESTNSDAPCFGIPSLKKYPMPDADHVKSAIKFFNYVDKEHEEELANNIIRYINKYKVSDINPSEKNRFFNYYTPAKDSVMTGYAAIVPYGASTATESVRLKRSLAFTHSGKNYYPVYIVLTANDTPLGNTIRAVTQEPYSHASISFDPSMNDMYSFGNKINITGNRQYNSFGSTNEMFNQKRTEKTALRISYMPKSTYGIYCIFCTEEQVKLMMSRVNAIFKHQDQYKFNIIGLVKYAFGKPSHDPYKLFCSQFVTMILNTGKNGILDRDSSLYSPYEISELRGVQFIETGVVKDYDEKTVRIKTKEVFEDIINSGDLQALESALNIFFESDTVV